MPGLKKGIKQIKMQDGGTKRQTREAISKNLKAKGLADVTKEELDRFKKRQKFKGSDKEALRMLLNQRKAKPKVKATGLDDKLLKPFTKERIGARKKQVASDTKAAQDKLAKQKKKAGTIVGGALAAVPTARAATAASKAVKAVGGAKGIKQAATRARGEIKKEMAGRKIGAGRKTTGDLLKGTVQQFTKKQPAITKRQATLAAKKKKKAEAAAKRAQARSVDTKVKTLSKGARSRKFVNRASGGVFKGTF
tara:strand:- start:29 stop:781 length:753 start_codon:yes stop_codon:yes gene_type:complete